MADVLFRNPVGLCRLYRSQILGLRCCLTKEFKLVITIIIISIKESHGKKYRKKSIKKISFQISGQPLEQKFWLGTEKYLLYREILEYIFFSIKIFLNLKALISGFLYMMIICLREEWSASRIRALCSVSSSSGSFNSAAF